MYLRHLLIKAFRIKGGLLNIINKGMSVFFLRSWEMILGEARDKSREPWIGFAR